MASLRARPLSLLLAVSLVAACGGEKPPPADPTLSVALAGPAQVYCGSAPLVIQTTLVEGTPDSVEMLLDGQPVAQLSAPYQYVFDCPNQPERTHELIVEAKLQERAFRSAPKQIIVDRTRPLVTGPFASGETEVRKDAPIRLTFSEPMKTAPVTSASITLTDSTRVTLAWSPDQKVLTVTPEAAIPAPKSLTLSLRAADFQDLAGNPLAANAPTQWQWTVPAFLTEASLPRLTDSTYERARFALDRSGRPVLLWQEYTAANGTRNMYVARADPGGTTRLGGALHAAAQTNLIGEAAIAVDASNRPVVAWLERDSTEERVFARRWNGSSWEELGSVPNPIADKSASELVLATGDSDLPVLAWRETDMASKSRVYVYRWSGTAWAPVGAPIERPGATTSVGFPSLAIDKQGRPVLSVSEISPEPSFPESLVVLRWSGTAWDQIGESLRPVESSAGSVVERSSLALDAQGQPAVLFELFTSGETSSSDDLHFARYGGTAWSNVQYVTGADVIKPSLGFDAQGELWATWQNIATSTTRKIFLQRLTGTPLSATLEGATDAVFANGGVGAPALLVLEDGARALRVVRRQ